MGLTDPRISFGIHQITSYSRTDGTPYGTLLVIGNANMNFSSALEELYGGSNRFPWAAENKTTTAEFSCDVKSLPDFLFTLFMGGTATTTNSSATGTVSTLVNVKGTTAFSATIGVATVTVTTAGDVKSGQYLVVAASATTVDIYALSSVEFQRGTVEDYVNDSLKITSSALTITMGGTTAVTGFGITLTGGSGTIGMTTGDSFKFTLDKAHGGLSDIVLGASGSTFPEHGQIVVAEKRSNGAIFEMDLYRCIGSGFPIPMSEKTFTISQMKIALLYDSARNGVIKIHTQAPA
jgi:hypothetical protein